TTVNRGVPVITASDQSVGWRVAVTVSSLFSVSDIDNDAIAGYEFTDHGTDPSTGYFLVGGVKHAGDTFSVGSLTDVLYVGGRGPGSETLDVRAYDGVDWGAVKSWTMTTTGHPSIVEASDGIVFRGQSVSAANLFRSSDVDGGQPVKYEFRDEGVAPWSGHFMLNGVEQPADHGIVVDASDLARVAYVGGSQAGTDPRWVRVNDGQSGSDWAAWMMATVYRLPVVTPTAGKLPVLINRSVAASSLFNAVDPDGDATTQYEFQDVGAGATSGHFTLS